MSRMETQGGLEPRSRAGLLAGGSTVQLICGAGAAVLAIIILAGFMGTVVGRILMEIAILAVSAALLIEGSLITARLNWLLVKVSPQAQEPTLVSGLSAEFLAGCTGIVLGILGLIGFYPTILASIAIVIFGGAIGLGALSRALAHLMAFDVARPNVPAEIPAYDLRFARESASVGAGAHLLAGSCLVALGIVALLGVVPMTLVVVSLLSAGGVLMLRGASVGSVAAGFFGERMLEEREQLRPAA